MYEHCTETPKQQTEINALVSTFFSQNCHSSIRDVEHFVLEFSNKAPSDQLRKVCETIRKVVIPFLSFCFM